MQKPTSSATALPTFIALLLAALLGACEMGRGKGVGDIFRDKEDKTGSTQSLPGKGEPANASPAVDDGPDILKYPWRATRFV